MWQLQQPLLAWSASFIVAMLPLGGVQANKVVKLAKELQEARENLGMRCVDWPN
jgi:hypothetical protein